MAKPNREVTEFDLRALEFQHPSIKPEDYEFRDDGKLVRKDRWETCVRRIVGMLGWSRREFEVHEIPIQLAHLLDRGVNGDDEYDSWVIEPRGVLVSGAAQGEDHGSDVYRREHARQDADFADRHAFLRDNPAAPQQRTHPTAERAVRGTDLGHEPDHVPHANGAEHAEREGSRRAGSPADADIAAPRAAGGVKVGGTADRPLPGLETLSNVIECLRADARYVDEEGEATNRLQDLLDAARYGNCDYWCPACSAEVSKPEHRVGVPQRPTPPPSRLVREDAYVAKPAAPGVAVRGEPSSKGGA